MPFMGLYCTAIISKLTIFFLFSLPPVFCHLFDNLSLLCFPIEEVFYLLAFPTVEEKVDCWHTDCAVFHILVYSIPFVNSVVLDSVPGQTHHSFCTGD